MNTFTELLDWVGAAATSASRFLGTNGDGRHDEEIDFNKDKFNPRNGRHVELLKQKLSQFETSLKALRGFDVTIYGSPVLINSAIWLIGAYRWPTALLVDVAIALAMNQNYFGRAKFKNEFDQAYNELLNAYKWYTKEARPELTQDPMCLELLGALIPYTKDWRQLVFFDLGSVSPNDISPKFIDIFEHSPHRVVLVLNKDVRPEASLNAKKGDDGAVLTFVPEFPGKSGITQVYGLFAGATNLYSGSLQVLENAGSDVNMKVYGHDAVAAPRESPKLR
jgi:hypothetical protein